MNASEVRGNEGELGVQEVWNDVGGGRGDTGHEDQWSGEFDGIRSDVDFRRALAIEGLSNQGQQQRAVAPQQPSAVVSPNPMMLKALKALKTLRATGEALSVWRAIRLAMR